MTEERLTMNDILNQAEESLKEDYMRHWDDEEMEDFLDDPGDTIHEIADSNVPVYTYDLMMLAAGDLCLATEDPELGPAFDGSPTPVNIIAANVYERITEHLYEWVSDNEDRIREEIEERRE